MAVPNTNTFSFWDVSDAVHGDHAAGRSLKTAFTSSDFKQFDYNYGNYGMNPKTMYGFRNYGSFVPPGNSVVIMYAIDWDSGDGIPNYVRFANSQAEAVAARDAFNTPPTNESLSGNTAYLSGTLGVGTFLYKYNVNNTAFPYDDGWYIPGPSYTTVIHVVGGVVQSPIL